VLPHEPRDGGLLEEEIIHTALLSGSPNS